MTKYVACGKQVLANGNYHVADACDIFAAELIAAALNNYNPIENIEQPTKPAHQALDRPSVTVHIVRQESDEYACACGARWDRNEGDDHP